MNRNEEAFNAIKDAVSRNGLVLKLLSNDVKANKEIVKLAVTNNGLALQYASNDLRADLDIIKAAMIQDKNAIKYAIFNDQDQEIYVNALTEIDPFIRLHFDRNDEEVFVLQAIKESANALEYASERLQQDRAFILAAVLLNGLALEFVREVFKKDKFIVLAAGQQNGEAFKHMSDSPDFRGDKDVFISCIQADSCWMAGKLQLLMDDRDVAVAAARLDGLFALSFNHSDEDYYLSRISKHPEYLKEDLTKWFEEEVKDFQRERYFIMEAVKYNGLALEFAKEVFKNDKFIVLAAINENPKALEFASSSLQEDPDIKERAKATTVRKTLVCPPTIFDNVGTFSSNMNHRRVDLSVV